MMRRQNKSRQDKTNTKCTTSSGLIAGLNMIYTSLYPDEYEKEKESGGSHVLSSSLNFQEYLHRRHDTLVQLKRQAGMVSVWEEKEDKAYDFCGGTDSDPTSDKSAEQQGAGQRQDAEIIQMHVVFLHGFAGGLAHWLPNYAAVADRVLISREHKHHLKIACNRDTTSDGESGDNGSDKAQRQCCCFCPAPIVNDQQLYVEKALANDLTTEIVNRATAGTKTKRLIHSVYALDLPGFGRSRRDRNTAFSSSSSASTSVNKASNTTSAEKKAVEAIDWLTTALYEWCWVVFGGLDTYEEELAATLSHHAQSSTNKKKFKGRREIIFVGHSFGAYLSMLLTLRLRHLNAHYDHHLHFAACGKGTPICIDRLFLVDPWGVTPLPPPPSKKPYKWSKNHENASRSDSGDVARETPNIPGEGNFRHRFRPKPGEGLESLPFWKRQVVRFAVWMFHHMPGPLSPLRCLGPCGPSAFFKLRQDFAVRWSLILSTMLEEEERKEQCGEENLCVPAASVAQLQSVLALETNDKTSSHQTYHIASEGKCTVNRTTQEQLPHLFYDYTYHCNASSQCTGEQTFRSLCVGMAFARCSLIDAFLYVRRRWQQCLQEPCKQLGCEDGVCKQEQSVGVAGKGCREQTPVRGLREDSIENKKGKRGADTAHSSSVIAAALDLRLVNDDVNEWGHTEGASVGLQQVSIAYGEQTWMDKQAGEAMFLDIEDHYRRSRLRKQQQHDRSATKMCPAPDFSVAELDEGGDLCATRNASSHDYRNRFFSIPYAGHQVPTDNVAGFNAALQHVLFDLR